MAKLSILWGYKMQINWKKLIICLLIWLTTEILFNFIGIDDLADYSEFIFERCEINNIPVCIVLNYSN